MRKNTQPELRKYVIFSAKITVIIQQEDIVIIQKEDTWTIYKMLLLLDSVRLFPCPRPFLVFTVNLYMKIEEIM